MIRLAILLTTAASAASVAASTKASFVQVQNGLGGATATYDLVVSIANNDDWTSTAMTAEITGGVFFQHPLGANGPPDTTLFGLAPTLAWDTFTTFAEGWPNTATTGKTPGYGGAPVFGPDKITAVWFDVLPNGGDGDWVMARLSVVDLQPGWQLKVSGANTSVKSGAPLEPFSFVVPEPAPFAPLAAVMLLCALRVRPQA